MSFPLHTFNSCRLRHFEEMENALNRGSTSFSASLKNVITGNECFKIIGFIFWCWNWLRYRHGNYWDHRKLECHWRVVDAAVGAGTKVFQEIKTEVFHWFHCWCRGMKLELLQFPFNWRLLLLPVFFNKQQRRKISLVSFISHKTIFGLRNLHQETLFFINRKNKVSTASLTEFVLDTRKHFGLFQVNLVIIVV